MIASWGYANSEPSSSWTIVPGKPSWPLKSIHPYPPSAQKGPQNALSHGEASLGLSEPITALNSYPKNLSVGATNKTLRFNLFNQQTNAYRLLQKIPMSVQRSHSERLPVQLNPRDLSHLRRID